MKNKLTNFILLVVLALAVFAVETGAQHKMRMGMTPATLTFPEGKDVIELPFEFKRQKILIPVSVNGSEPMPFVLDTGAPVAVLMDRKLSETLNLNIVGEARVGGVGEGEASTVPIAGDVVLEFGGIEITGATMAIGVAEGKLPDLGWDGVIGGPVFKNCVVDFDFANNVLRLYRPDKFTYEGNGSVLPLTINHGSFPYIDTEVSIDGKPPVPATFVIDTGAGLALSLSVENHDNLDLPAETVASIIGWGANGAVRGHTGRVTSLKLGDYVLENIVAGFPDKSSMHMLDSVGPVKRHGMIGAKILKRFRVVFDYTNERVIFEPNKSFDTPFNFNTTGIIPAPWTPGGESIEVASVIASSPAEMAGIKPGDHVIAMDGKPVADIPVDGIDEFLENSPGSRMTITVLRKSEQIKKELVLRELI